MVSSVPCSQVDTFVAECQRIQMKDSLMDEPFRKRNARDHDGDRYQIPVGDASPCCCG